MKLQGLDLLQAKKTFNVMAHLLHVYVYHQSPPHRSGPWIERPFMSTANTANTNQQPSCKV